MKELSTKDLVGICEMLAELLEAGKPLPSAVELLSRTAGSKHVRARLSIAHEAMARKGMDPGAAFARAGFPDFFCAQMKVAAQTGVFAGTLKELASWYRWQNDIKAKLRSALTYPTLLAIVGLSIVTFMIWSVVPKMAPMLEAIPEKERPQFIVKLFAFSSWAHAHPIIFFGCLVGTPVTLFLTRKVWFRFIKKYFLDLRPTEFKLKWMPWFTLYYYLDLASFFKSLAVCMHSGLDVLQALNITRDVVANVRLKEMVMGIRKRVMKGESFAEAVNRYMILPIVRSYMEVAEETGDFSGSALKVADYLFKRVDGVIGIVSEVFKMAVLLMVLGSIAAFVVKFATALYQGLSSVR